MRTLAKQQGRKLGISRFEGGRGRWRGSETSRLCRNSPLCMLRSTITSIINAISTVGTFSNNTGPLPWPSGANCQPDSPRLPIRQIWVIYSDNAQWRTARPVAAQSPRSYLPGQEQGGSGEGKICEVSGEFWAHYSAQRAARGISASQRCPSRRGLRCRSPPTRRFTM